MSTPAAPTTKHFFVYAPDDTSEGTFERRLSVRTTHLENAQKRIATGFFRVLGVLLTPESVETPAAQKKMIGSTFICEAESIAEVRRVVEEDVYYTTGVWDKEKILILPYIAATPLP